MQRGKVFSINKLKITAFFAENKLLIIALFVFLVGIILGVFVFDSDSNVSRLTENFIKDYINLRLNNGYFKIFLNSLFTYLLILMIFLIFGTSMLGVVVVPFVMCLCGIFFGNTTAYLYSEFALKGIAFNAVIFIPSTIVFAVCLLFACAQAMGFSLKISSLTVTNSVSYNLTNRFKHFLIMFLIFAGACVFSAVCDAAISGSFIKYFDF